MTREEMVKSVEHKNKLIHLYSEYAEDHQKQADEWRSSAKQLCVEVAMLERQIKEMR